MTQPNNSFGVTPGAGETIAMELIGGKKYGVVQEAGTEGHIKGTRPSYIMIIPPVAGTVAAANKVHFDIFNASGSGVAIHLHGLYFNFATDVIVAQALGIRFDLFRTTTVGSGGTTILSDQTSVTNTISKIDPADSVKPAQITARVAPTAGGTIQAWIGQAYLTTEEVSTNFNYHTQFQNMIRYEQMEDVSNLILPEGYGVKLVQGPVAISAPNLGFRVVFTLV